MARLSDFFRDRGGNFGVITAISAIPLLLSVGLGVDYSRHSSAYQNVQALADIVSLTVAASAEKNNKSLRDIADRALAANNLDADIQNVRIKHFVASNEKVEVELSGSITATFMSLAGWDQLNVSASALAERAMRYGGVEAALILDNTWSMSELDENGISRIGAIKEAARNLVGELLSTKDAGVRIGIVPYADYINIGTQYRNSPWISVPADYAVTTERTCQTKTTKTVCLSKAPKYSCTKIGADGVEEETMCGGGCTEQVTETVPPYESCSGGKTTKYKWYGCVGSRMTGTARLNDGSSGVAYPGYVETSQKCLNPIVALTDDKDELLSAIDGMVINIGSYKPYTYIPAGLVWGLNVLSPTAPLAEAQPFDVNNVKPRKVAVLMTDGENTRRFRSSDGRHIAFSGNATSQASQIKTVNTETVAICENMKAQNIEIFTVAFMIQDEAAKAMLKACATSPEHHYYDAVDATKLLSAFSGIAHSLREIRLAR